jgi:hypothetical protein
MLGIGELGVKLRLVGALGSPDYVRAGTKGKQLA